MNFTRKHCLFLSLFWQTTVPAPNKKPIMEMSGVEVIAYLMKHGKLSNDTSSSPKEESIQQPPPTTNKLTNLIQQPKTYLAEANFNKSINHNYCYTPQWETSHPKRSAAFRKALNEKGDVSTQSYDFNKQAIDTLRNLGINYEKYTNFVGNSLQQELCQEVVQGINDTATLKGVKKCKQLYEMVGTSLIEAFDLAQEANAMGECIGASCVIDQATTIVDYLKAVAKGAKDGLCSVGHNLANPRETVSMLKNFAQQFVATIEEYVPTATGENSNAGFAGSTCNKNALDKICQALQKHAGTVKQWWHDTPGLEIAAQAGYVTGKCAGLGIVAFGSFKLAKALKEFICPYIARESASFQTAKNTKLGPLNNNQINKAADAIWPSKKDHIFDPPHHNLSNLRDILGSEKKLAQEVIKQLPGKAPSSGVFRELPISVYNTEVHVSGRVIDGIPRIGTFYIPYDAPSNLPTFKEVFNNNIMDLMR